TAAVLSYVRSAWGNSAPPVAAGEVAKRGGHSPSEAIERNKRERRRDEMPVTPPSNLADIRELTEAQAFASFVRLVHRFQPIFNVLARPILGDAVALLNLAFQLVASAVDLGEIVVGELAPLLFDLALCLFPVSFYAVPVHRLPPSAVHGNNA